MSSISNFENQSPMEEELPDNNDKEILMLIDNFFLKSCLLICSKELSSSDSLREYLHLSGSWFEIMENYQTYDLPHSIDTWLHFDGKSTLPPLVIETYLDLRDLPESFLLRLMDKDGNLWSVCKGTNKTEVVLERWLLELDTLTPNGKDIPVEYNLLNNQISLLLRYLHTLIQLLPINSLIKSINKQYLSIGTRILDGSKPILSKGRIGLSKPIISSYSNQINETNIPKHLEQKKITPVWTKFGLLRVSVSYRKECKFELQNLHQPEEDGLKAHLTQRTKVIAGVSPTSHTFGNLVARNSISISPSSRANFGALGTSLDQQPSSLTKKYSGFTRQVQPFKVGSVNSLAGEKSTSQIASRNSSVSSVLVNTSARRSSIGSNFAINNHANINNNNVLLANNSNSTVASNVVPRADTGSIDSNSKYLSSFGNIRRHSSINRNIESINSIDRALKSGSDILINTNRRNSDNSEQQISLNNNLPQQTSNDELLAFVKMIDSKPDIKFKPKQRTSNKDGNVSHSLVRYQNLKSSNNILSEDLSMSYTLYQNQDGNKSKNNSPEMKAQLQGRCHSTSSNSKSPFYSLSPYSHTNIKGSHLQSQGFSTSAINSRKNSMERSRQSFLPPIYGGESMSYHDEHESTEEPHQSNKSGENMLSQDQKYRRGRSQSSDSYSASNRKWIYSRSPRSLPSSTPFAHTDNTHKLTYSQSNRLSQTALMSVPAQAKLHRPNIQSAKILEDEGRRMSHGKTTESSKDEGKSKPKRNYLESNQGLDVDDEVADDDLMFFMSDMHMRSDC